MSISVFDQIRQLFSGNTPENVAEILVILSSETERLSLAPQNTTNVTALVINKTAGVNLSGHRVVRTAILDSNSVTYCDATNLSNAGTELGITLGAALAGNDVSVLLEGEVEEPSWSWTPGVRLYVGASGTLVTNPAGLMWSRCVGIAESPTKIMFRLGEPIIQ